MRQFLEGERRLEQPTYSKRYLYQIMLDCWSKTPKERPSFANLARDLRKELETQRENENYLDVNIAKIDDGKSTNNKFLGRTFINLLFKFCLA